LILSHDPYNLIIAGVGGQGNVLASRILGDLLSRQGFSVTIGETFGASQRGGSVMSHLRISARSSYSPQIPKGKAHVILALEPVEAIRTLKDYGNPEVKVLCNLRPIHAIGVICGEQTYPSAEDLKTWIRELSQTSWFINATAEAVRLGNPILSNIIAVGALAGTGVLPLDRGLFETVLSSKMPPSKVALNLTAYDRGMKMIQVMGPIEELRQEHGAVMKVFSILQEISGKLEKRESQALDAFRRVLEFLQVFVDQCHHAKEEEFLFPALKKAQSRNRSLIEELVSEHEQGRIMIRAMKASVGENNRKQDASLGALVGTIEEYLRIFRNHIRKENSLLFPEARDLLPAINQERMSLEFQKLEQERIGEGRHQSFHRMIEELGGNQ
jgi:indolepyruvate ferredoxin oxidoreductase, beta subunit